MRTTSYPLDEFSILTSRNFPADGIYLRDISSLSVGGRAVHAFYQKDHWDASRISSALIDACYRDDCFHAISQLIYNRRLLHHRSLQAVWGLMGWNKAYMRAYLADNKLSNVDMIWAKCYMSADIFLYACEK